MSQVFVVVPAHNRRQTTRECLLALSRQEGVDTTVVVVDDGSTDGTSEMIVKEFPDVALLHGDGELWWTGATNMGVRWALERCEPADYILTLNDDVWVSPDYVEKLARFAHRCQRTIIGSVCLESLGRGVVTDGGVHVEWRTARWWCDNAGKELAECAVLGVAETSPDALSGRGTLIPVQCFWEVGLYDERRLPQYGADYEFSIRAQRAGYGLKMSYDAPVYSHVAETDIYEEQRRPRGARQFVAKLVSRRSAACLLYRWRFGWLAAPRRVRVQYVILDTLRVVFGAIRDQVMSRR